MENPGSGKRKDVTQVRERYLILLVIIAGFAVYANALGGKLIWDDDLLLRKNIYVRDLSHIPGIFTRGIDSAEGTKYQFYRPVQTLSYAVERRLWGLDPRGYHFVNIVFHILAALCVYRLVKILFADRILALIASLLFVTHPVHTEAVAYISGRADPFSAVFLLTALVAYIRYAVPRPQSPDTRYPIPDTRLLTLVLSYALALLSRESALILPLLILAYHYVFRRKIGVKPFALVIIVSALYIFLRVGVLQIIPPHLYISSAFLQRLPGLFAAIAGYIRLLFLPFGLHMEYGSRSFAWTDPSVITGLILTAALLACVLSRRARDPLVSFSILWFFLALLPHSNLYPLTAYMAEHWLYLPSIGAFILAGAALRHLYAIARVKPLAIAFTAAVIIFFGALTLAQNGYWRDPVIFCERTLVYSPKNARVYNLLGLEYENTARPVEAIEAFNKAISLEGRNPLYYNNLGNSYGTAGRFEAAVASYKKAVELKPDYAEAYVNLSITHFERKEFGEAVKYCDRAVELGYNVDPRYLSVIEPHRRK